MIDAYASQAHYLRHVLPLWEALPHETKGSLYTPSGLGTGVTGRTPPRSGGPVIAASHADYRVVRNRPIVLVEHGAGQSYGGDPRSAGHPAYSGGKDRDRVILFVCPNEAVARRNLARYPKAEAVVTGWIQPLQLVQPVIQVGPVVAVSFHWECKLCPESRSAWPHYDPVLSDLASRFEVLGHGHPKMFDRLALRWAELGVRAEPDWPAVLAEADVLVADNSSALYEFAASGKPVVVLDAPWYRRDVDHGLRFWEHADVGVRIGDPSDLCEAVALALSDPPEVKARREAICEQVLPMVPGGLGEAARMVTGMADREFYAEPVRDPYAPRSRRGSDGPREARERPLERRSALGAPEGADVPPDGPERAVLGWVGSDPTRARMALVSESVGNPRDALVGALRRIAHG